MGRAGPEPAMRSRRVGPASRWEANRGAYRGRWAPGRFCPWGSARSLLAASSRKRRSRRLAEWFRFCGSTSRSPSSRARSVPLLSRSAGVESGQQHAPGRPSVTAPVAEPSVTATPTSASSPVPSVRIATSALSRCPPATGVGRSLSAPATSSSPSARDQAGARLDDRLPFRMTSSTCRRVKVSRRRLADHENGRNHYPLNCRDPSAPRPARSVVTAVPAVAPSENVFVA